MLDDAFHPDPVWCLLVLAVMDNTQNWSHDRQVSILASPVSPQGHELRSIGMANVSSFRSPPAC